MKVLPINNWNNYNSGKSHKVLQSPVSTKVQSLDSISFQGNYKQAYLEGLKTPVKDIWECSALFRSLRCAAKTEDLSIRFDHYLSKDFIELITIAKGINSEIILAKSDKYPYPLVTLEGGGIAFHHPDNGECGNGNITFYLDGNTVALQKNHYAVDESKGVETFEFWDSGRIKRYSTSHKGYICEDIKYDEYGVKRKSFWDFIFGG